MPEKVWCSRRRNGFIGEVYCMNWYKIARLEEQNPNGGIPAYSICSHCHRYKKENGDWVPASLGKMDHEEVSQISSRVKAVTYDICEECKNGIEKSESLPATSAPAGISAPAGGEVQMSYQTMPTSAIQKHKRRKEIAPSRL